MPHHTPLWLSLVVLLSAISLLHKWFGCKSNNTGLILDDVQKPASIVLSQAPGVLRSPLPVSLRVPNPAPARPSHHPSIVEQHVHAPHLSLRPSDVIASIAVTLALAFGLALKPIYTFRHPRQRPQPQDAATSEAFLLLAVGSEPAPRDGAVAALLEDAWRALHRHLPEESGDARQRIGQAQVMGMQGRSVLTWLPGNASVKLEIDCTPCLGPGASPVKQAISITMSVPTTEVVDEVLVDAGGGESASALCRWDAQCVAWEQDWSGMAGELELEDAEAAALRLWLCTGQWLPLQRRGVLRAAPLSPEARALLQTVAEEQWPEVDLSAGGGLSLSVRGGCAAVHVVLDGRTCLPAVAVLPLSDGVATLRLAEWGSGPCQPTGIVYTAPGHSAVMHTWPAEEPSALSPSPTCFTSPVPLTGSLLGPRNCAPDIFPRARNPLGAWFDDWGGVGDPCDLPLWQGEGGHLFCKPRVGGHDLGYFVLDTGTPGLVLDPEALPAEVRGKAERFGVHTIPGLGGPVRRTALIRGLGPLTLGPFMLERPLFHEAALRGAVRPPATAGPSPRVAGVLGSDFLRHVRVEIVTRAGAPSLRLRRPGGVVPPRQALGWQRARFLRSVPHVPATLCLGNGTDGNSVNAPQAAMRGLFRVALGTGGARVVLGEAAATALGALRSDVPALSPTGSISAPGSHDQPMARQRLLPAGARLVPLHSVGLPGIAYRDVLALCPGAAAADDLELSCYADGVLGALLFRDSVLILDYSSRRISVTPLPDARP